jgi:hypothetical protein
MLLWTIKWVIISLTLIFLAHYLFIFFTNTLTVPKVKDLVNKPSVCYSELLSSNTYTPEKVLPSTNNAKGNNSNNNNNTATVSMQDELNTFLRELKRP